MTKFVLGTYEKVTEATQVFSRLVEQGIPKNSISIVANEDVLEEINETTHEEIKTEEPTKTTPDSGFVLGRVENLLSLNRTETEPGYGDIDFSAYQSDIDDGKILILVEESFEAEALRISK